MRNLDMARNGWDELDRIWHHGILVGKIGYSILNRGWLIDAPPVSHALPREAKVYPKREEAMAELEEAVAIATEAAR